MILPLGKTSGRIRENNAQINGNNQAIDPQLSLTLQILVQTVT